MTDDEGGFISWGATEIWPVDVDEFLADTAYLSAEETGAYAILTALLWRDGQGHNAIPLDQARLARMARVSPRRWQRVWSSIERFFEVKGDQITGRRIG